MWWQSRGYSEKALLGDLSHPEHPGFGDQSTWQSKGFPFQLTLARESVQHRWHRSEGWPKSWKTDTVVSIWLSFFFFFFLKHFSALELCFLFLPDHYEFELLTPIRINFTSQRKYKNSFIISQGLASTMHYVSVLWRVPVWCSKYTHVWVKVCCFLKFIYFFIPSFLHNKDIKWHMKTLRKWLRNW